LGGGTGVRPQPRGWRKLRSFILDRDPLCVLCRRAPANEVDHIVPRADGGDDAPENLQGLCKSCHSRKTMGEVRAGGGFDS